MNYFVEKEPLGEAGAIKKFESQLDQTFYYIYGDILTLMDYTKMAAAYDEKVTESGGKAIGMERVKKTDSYADADVVELDERGRFKAMHVKPHTQEYPNAYRTGGSFILDKHIVSYMPEGAAFTLNKQLIPAAVAAGEDFYAYECSDYSKAFDNLEKWKEVEDYLSKNNIRFEDFS